MAIKKLLLFSAALFCCFNSYQNYGMDLQELSAVDKADGIHSYEAARDKEAIIKLWTDNYHVITHATENPDKEFIEGNVASWEKSNDQNSIIKTYLSQGKPIGFVHYTFYEPFFFKCFGPKADIQELAISKEHRSKGCGSKLMQHALNDCQKRSAQSVSLLVTIYMVGSKAFEQDEKLGSGFYGKLGFKRAGATPGRYLLRLKPHPAILAGYATLNWMKNIFK